MPDPWRLLALPPLSDDVLHSLFGGPQVEVLVPSERTAAGLLGAVEDVDIIVGDWTGAMPLTSEVVAASPRLSFVQQPSAGVDSVDVEALTAAGIPLANAGPANAVSVAEWCLGAAFATLRSLAYGDAAVRAGGWPQLDLSQRGGGELAGSRVGIVGMGRIGKECAWRFAALGCDVAHWSRKARPADESGGARWMPFQDLLAHSNLLILVVALSPATRGLIGAAELALLPPGAIVINAARGGIVDETALLQAVRSGALSGAALDVFTREPLPVDDPLRSDDRILLSPHAAAGTPQALARLIDTVTDNVRLAISGRPVNHVVNGLEPRISRR